MTSRAKTAVDTASVSEKSDNPDDQEDDEDEEEEEEEEQEDEETEEEELDTESEKPVKKKAWRPKSQEHTNVVWTGSGKRTPVLIFKPQALEKKEPQYKVIGEKYHLAYKLIRTECKLLRSILSAHGFHEAHPNSNDFNLMWTGSHLKPYTLRTLTEFQKVNHFPRSYEITRKDRLFKNIQRMQHTKGPKHFDFVPPSFITPGEFQDFCTYYLKDKGPWIVKPVASSRGRGIFLINHPEQVPLDETVIVCKYIPNPLLIDGFKFDVRLYVGVTSYDPLLIYLFEEGLTRFATVRYDKNAKSLRNHYMHLTNYSVNKKSKDYVGNDDPDVEDYGNKWSMGAMLRYLSSEGYDTTALMMRIEDVVIKTILSAEMPIATACKMFVPFKGNCFELYGFDILIDSNLRPWILEVNLSPSLACDSPLDLKIKGHMLSDLFSLTGFVCHDPMVRKPAQSNRNQDVQNKNPARAQSTMLRRRRGGDTSDSDSKDSVRTRPQSAGSAGGKESKGGSGLSAEDGRTLRRVKEEYSRRGGWVRIFPTADSWDLYSQFMEFSTTSNLMLHQRLYPYRHQVQGKSGYSTQTSKLKSVHIHSAPRPILGSEVIMSKIKNMKFEELLSHAVKRAQQYERKLSTGTKKKRRVTKRRPSSGCPQTKKGPFKGTLVQGVPEGDETPTSQSAKSEMSSRPGSSVQTNKPGAKQNTAQQQQQGKGDEPKVPPQQKPQVTYNYNQPSTVKKPPQTQPDPSAPPPPMVRQEPQGQEAPPPPVSSYQYKAPPTPAPASYNQLNRPRTTEPVTTRNKVITNFETASVIQPAPPPPKFDVVGVLEKGGSLSKVQARSAFATYLSRVQERLMSETGSSDKGDREAANEQMDLVLRFLKRAAVNLQQPFKVVVPSRKLPINDRRRILSKQLGDFVHVYSRETDQLRQRTKVEEKHLKKDKIDMNMVDEDKFGQFMNVAGESELEKVLTTYTKMNKSASIFLGSNSKSSYEGPPVTAQATQSDISLTRRKEGSDMAGKENRGIRVPQETQGSNETDTVQIQREQSGTRQNPLSSYAGAVPIYSAKLTNNNIKQRPASASTQRSGMSRTNSRPGSGRPMSAGSSRSRPSSATVYRERPDGSSAPHHYTDSYNENTVNEALHRLAQRQQARTYAPGSTSNLLGPNGAKEPVQPSRNHLRTQSLDRPAAMRSQSNTSLLTQSSSGHSSRSSNSGPVKPITFPNSYNNGDSGQRSKVSHAGDGGQRSQPGSGGDMSQRSQGGRPGDVGQRSITSLGSNDRTSTGKPPVSRSNYNDYVASYHSEGRARTSLDLTANMAGHHSHTKSAPPNKRTHLQSANDTFNSFAYEEDGFVYNDDGDSDNEAWSNAYNQVTGVSPLSSGYVPSRGSTQYQLAQQQQQMKQQKMIEQSRTMLEQSKAKHQAMIAQAHAAQHAKMAKEPESAMQQYAPKPPSQPPSMRKPTSSHRLARAVLPEDNVSDCHFYSSIKYDSATGTVKHSLSGSSLGIS
ncbi:tubulin polyglutamylase TTLL5 isoform X2 [Lingula anatina]|uniref:Tubulin--tyrosine ligase-like protein 5 n=1 Tax=Lingula anatina TaxID=7574 RepID=A0A1S3KHB9_LINAN|nr:tubulin polyglutamylase TTLL5 isoform X2 [Lingula anatina]|eukprot:XP_013422025.1 tubulin polyglutamylase TTLL5 isoform X2 [Lingula anatina]